MHALKKNPFLFFLISIMESFNLFCLSSKVKGLNFFEGIFKAVNRNLATYDYRSIIFVQND